MPHFVGKNLTQQAVPQRNRDLAIYGNSWEILGSLVAWQVVTSTTKASRRNYEHSLQRSPIFFWGGCGPNDVDDVGKCVG